MLESFFDIVYLIDVVGELAIKLVVFCKEVEMLKIC